jgi:hypothetical protein
MAEDVVLHVLQVDGLCWYSFAVFDHNPWEDCEPSIICWGMDGTMPLASSENSAYRSIEQPDDRDGYKLYRERIGETRGYPNRLLI